MHPRAGLHYTEWDSPDPNFDGMPPVKRLLLPLKIALRFLMSSPMQSAAIVAGIAVGITTQVFVGTIIISLQDSTLQSTVGSSPHVTVQPVRGESSVRLDARTEALLANTPELEPGAVAPVRTASGYYSDDVDSTSLSLVGGELSALDGVYGARSALISDPGSVPAELGDRDVLIGREFANEYELSVGDQAPIKINGGSFYTLTVRGIFDVGSAAFNTRTAFVSGSLLGDVLSLDNGEYSAIHVQLTDPFASELVANRWRPQLPDAEVVEWQAQNAQILSALTSQNMSSYMIQAFVLVAVALGIGSTLAIAAVQKTKQIGILKAIGLTDGQSGAIFVLQALVLGIIGSTVGIGLSLLSLWGFSFAPLPFTLSTQPSFMAASWALGVVVSALSALPPTRSTNRLDPIEVIQGA